MAAGFQPGTLPLGQPTVLPIFNHADDPNDHQQCSPDPIKFSVSLEDRVHVSVWIIIQEACNVCSEKPSNCPDNPVHVFFCFQTLLVAWGFGRGAGLGV